jgi:hypothetical protein
MTSDPLWLFPPAGSHSLHVCKNCMIGKCPNHS